MSNDRPRSSAALVTPWRRQSWLRPLLIAGAAWVALQSWQSYTDRQLGEVLAAQAKPGDIVMLSSTDCTYCEHARRYLTEHQVAFKECFIETDAACAERYRAQQSPGTPVLLVRGQRLVGFEPQRVAQALSGT